MDCVCEYYLELTMKAELTIVYSGYLIPLEDTLENRSAKSSAECFRCIEIQLHLFNGRRKHI